MRNGDKQPKTNKTIPIIKFDFFSSNIPEAIKITPKNPNIIGSICEKIVVPVIAILSHNNLFIL